MQISTINSLSPVFLFQMAPLHKMISTFIQASFYICPLFSYIRAFLFSTPLKYFLLYLFAFLYLSFLSCSFLNSFFKAKQHFFVFKVGIKPGPWGCKLIGMSTKPSTRANTLIVYLKFRFSSLVFLFCLTFFPKLLSLPFTLCLFFFLLLKKIFISNCHCRIFTCHTDLCGSKNLHWPAQNLQV